MNCSMVQAVRNPKGFKKVVKYFFEYNKFPHYAFDVPNLEYDSLYVTLTSFVQAPLTLVSLKKIYQLLDYESTNDDKLIISKYKKISSLDELFSFSFDLMRKNYFAKHTISIFKIIFNKWLINNNYLPLVFYPGVTNKIYELVKDSNDD
ncbi:MAG: hypothetical protein LBV58_00265, partial [Acholeplasmatales bacterium]|nr:hypothetical protein [Acholeplasmatales bacterium]